jgi:ribosomal-protein-alanine N-acetyltransferase
MHTQRLLLRPLTLDDTPALFALRTDPEVNRYLGREPEQHPDEVAAFIQKIQQNVAAGHAAFWAIQWQDQPELVGTICLWNWDRERSRVEVGYALLPAHWGRGVLQEVLPAVLAYAFEILDFQTVVAVLESENLKSVRLLERAGFALTNEVVEEEENLVVYALTRPV